MSGEPNDFNDLARAIANTPPLRIGPQVVAVGKPEAERAAELKERAREVLIELCSLMDEGLRDGLLIRFITINVNPLSGRHEPVDLHIEKRF